MRDDCQRTDGRKHAHGRHVDRSWLHASLGFAREQMHEDAFNVDDAFDWKAGYIDNFAFLVPFARWKKPAVVRACWLPHVTGTSTAGNVRHGHGATIAIARG